MRERRIVLVVAAGVLLDGLLAGSTVDRLVAGLPAWRAVGVEAWARYSRHADLGNGLVLYPLLAIGGGLLALAAVAMFRRDPAAARAAAFPLYAGAVLAVAGLLTTIGAAPNMLRLRQVSEPSLLATAFDRFYLWSSFRAVFQVLLFPTELWALVTLSRGTTIPR